jgi:SAM-dependent methyltransferase
MTQPLDAGNADQADYWNGEAGRAWTALQESQDRLFAPITAALFDAAAPRPGEGVIDVGCGAGETTLAAAAATGRALGVDVSEPLLERARARAAAAGSPARFALADATAYDFSDEGADLLISRFGVMFFANPAASFANLRRGLKAGARLVFVCWREPKFNPWLMLPYSAAVKHAPPPPRPGPEDPGPFAFSDEQRVRRILGAAGFSGVSLTPLDFSLDVGVGEGLDNAVAKSLEIGPASRALADQPEAVRAAATAEIRAALAEHLQDGAVPLGAAVWIVRATA